MNALEPHIESALVAIIRAAAREEILPRFRNLTKAQISTKSGPGDLVTEADIGAERVMTAAIQALLPDALVVGEEAIAGDPPLRDEIGGADLCVILDPVDGTWNFAHGLAMFGVILAVTRRGQPVFGVIYDPLLDDWLVTRTGFCGMATPDRIAPVTVSEERRIERMTGFVPFGLFKRDLRGRVLEQLPPFSRVTSLRCAAHEYRLLAQGAAQFALSGPVHNPWDHAAGALAVQAAGGVVRFVDGQPYEAGRRRGVILAANRADVWDDIAARFAFLRDV
jgi:fructose-1,6-bisphosphatase/inositol monophosphatase family enzyme